jgi:GNAT superfamily N-acetyltransferase
MAPGMMIRPALPADLPEIAAMIRELAEFEKLLDQVRWDEGQLGRSLFGERPAADVLMGEADGAVVGFALFFSTFSTFAGRAGIWLEDLFVRPAARRRGLGTALLRSVARVAVERGCARFEWSVLDWNAPAIALYRAMGARAMDEWTIQRVEGAALMALAAPDSP